jgi:hypothetical protein
LFLGRLLKTHVHEQYLNGQKPLRPIILLSRKYMAATEFVCDFGASEGNPPELSVTHDDQVLVEQRR